MIHPERQLSKDVLLGVLGPDGREQRLETGDVAARGGDPNAVVQRHQVGCLRAAPAVARAADALRIDLRAGLQVVHRSHGVPEHEASGVLAQQDAADADHGVGGGAPEPGQCGRHLAALALIDRIEHERRHPVDGQQGPHRLIGLVCLGLGGMPTRHEDTGERGWVPSSIRQEQQGSDIVLRLTLEDDLLDCIPITTDHAGHTRVQGRSLRKTANRREKLLTQVLLIGGDLVGRRPLLVLLPPLLE